MNKNKISHTKRDIVVTKPIHCVLKTMINISLQEPNSQKLIKKLLQKIECRYHVKVLQYFIQKSHLHLLIQTPTEKNLSLSMCYLASLIARYFNKKLKRKGSFWKDRYFSSVKRSAAEIQRTISYIAGQMKNLSPFDNPFSSLCGLKWPFNFPQYLLNMIGVGKSPHKFIQLITYGQIPYFRRKSTKKREKYQQVTLF